MSDVKRGVWVTYTSHYGGGHQLDPNPTTYSKIAIFDDELVALRYANNIGAKVIRVEMGQNLEAAVRADHRSIGMAPA